MDIFRLLAAAALIFCLGSLVYQMTKLLIAGNKQDFSKPSGSTKNGIIYSFTRAMSPFEKESAYLHLPTYIAGLLFHLGVFLSFPVFVLMIISPKILFFSQYLTAIISLFLLISSFSGLFILFKRFFKRDIRAISGADDYISNGLTTISLFMSSIVLLTETIVPLYFVFYSILLVWVPIGKTRHLIYFFFARYHLGRFYGRRNSWPQKKVSNG